MDRRYRFERMHLLRSPGFSSPPFGTLDGFSSGLNILYGPNGIGKSTLIRAMRALLAQTVDGHLMDSEATVKSGEEGWALSRVHGELSQVRVESGEHTTLPGRNDVLSDAYFFGLHELLSEVGDNPLFVARVQSEMQGGIDLEAAREKSGAIAKFPVASKGESKREAEARVRVQQLKGDIAAHSSLFEEIKRIEAELAEETDLLREEKLVEQAIIYLERLAEEASLAEEKASYDPRIARFNASTEQELESLHLRYEEALDEEREAREAVTQTEAEIAGQHVDERFLSDDESSSHIERLIDTYQTLQNALEAAKTKRRDAKAALASWEGELSWLVVEAPEAVTLKEMVHRLSALAQSCEPLRTRLSAAEQLRKGMGTFDEGVSARLDEQEQTKARVMHLISLTARHGGTARAPLNRYWWAVLPLFALSALLALLWAPSAIIGAVVALTVLLLLRQGVLTPRATELEEEIAQMRARLSESTLGGDWSLGALTELLERITVEIGRLEAQAAKNERIRAAEAEVDEARGAWHGWLDRFQDAASDLRLAPSPLLEGAQFFHFSERLLTWLERSEALAIAVGGEEAANTSFFEAQERLRSYCALAQTDESLLIGEARTLSRTIIKVQGLTKSLDERTNRLQQTEKRRAGSKEKLATFYKDHGFEFGDRVGVTQLYREWKGYAQVSENLSIVRRGLAGFTEEEKALADGSDEAALKVRLEEIALARGALQKLRRDQGALQERYDRLSNSDELERADDELRRAREALEAHRREAVQGRIVQALYQRIKEERQSRYQPMVLKRASSWLMQITHNRYTLGIGEENFIAHDTLSDKPYQLFELSSGTRIQLLFSIRMAFLELMEQDGAYRMPLFFDELMANSDDERSLAIAEAIATVASERQIFYATAQLDEVEKLKLVVKEDIVLFDLEAITKQTSIARHPFVEPTVKPIILIEPMDDYSAYATALGVERPSLFEAVGRLHSWYLCLESAELHRLLVRGFERAGQAAAAERTYQRRLALLGEVADLARIGRARVLRVSDLSIEDFPLRRDVGYYQQIVTFLSEAERTGNDLLAAVEERSIKGMREGARSSLTSWLNDMGYATDEEPLDEEKILARLARSERDLTVEGEEYFIVRRYLEALALQ